MRTITIKHPIGGVNMDETEVISRVLANTQELPVVRPDFAALVNQAHGLPAPLLPAPRAVIDPEDQLPRYPRSGATRWTKDEIAEAMWKFVIVMLIVLAGLMVWNSDTGQTIRQELSTPQINLSPEAPQSAERPATQSAAPRSAVRTAQTQSAGGGVALPTQSATRAPQAKDIKPALAAVSASPTQSTGATCAELGRVNIPRGDPDYTRARDLDGDGVACDGPSTAPVASAEPTDAEPQETPSEAVPTPPVIETSVGSVPSPTRTEAEAG